ncbi:hypothetical protein ERJ75_001820800 [Trypanosoma vivax]|nr:hypothetical protein ERJ75_001820800 [Trypanosoma vivax]
MSEPIRDVNMENLFANNIDVQMMEEGNSASADIIKSLSGLHVDGSCTGTGNGDGVVFGNELVSDGAELEAAADRTDNGETLSQVVGDEYAQQNIFGRLGCMNAGGGLSAQQLFEAQDSADGTTPIFGASTQQYDLPDTLKKNTSSSTSSHTSETARRSPMNASMDSGLTVYSSIETSALQGKRLDFRKFTEDKNVSAATAKEQSAGVFVGQLPSTYTEEDTAALLRAIGDDANVPVVVRDVKSHNQSRTCAFVIVNSSALSVLLSYSKRVLCDTSCVWIVERDKASGLKEFVNSFSRDRLRGVPKAALVLEELTPQYMRGHSSASKDGKAFGRRGGEMLPVMDGLTYTEQRHRGIHKYTQ